MTHCLLVFMFSKFKAVIVKKTNLLTYSHLSYRRCFFLVKIHPCSSTLFIGVNAIIMQLLLTSN